MMLTAATAYGKSTMQLDEVLEPIYPLHYGEPLESPAPIAEEHEQTEFTLRLKTDVKGAGDSDILINVSSTLAPLGVAHLQELVADKFYNGAAFFRVAPDFVIQFGIAGTPEMNEKWTEPIRDDPVASSNTAGTLVYATAGADTRTTQMFINLIDNTFLDAQGFAPFGKVVQGMDVINAIYNPTPDDGMGVDQGMYKANGNDWIRSEYPEINFIKKMTFE